MRHPVRETMHLIRYIFVLVLLACGLPISVQAETLEEVELRDLARYLASLSSGQPGSAEQVERLADISFAGLRQTMQAYADLQSPIEPHTHRSFQALLERMSRTALVPWPMLNLYSPDLARFLTQTDDTLAEQLFGRLLTSGDARRGLDLAVRLTPQQTLSHLTAGKAERRIELLEAWNRRLGRGHETRSLRKLDQNVAAISKICTPHLSPSELAALLQFVSHWPSQATRYQECLVQCLQSNDPQVVLAALAVQQRVPKALEFNAALIKRFAHEPRIVEEAIRNYASDESHDHAATLADIWSHLTPDQARARYNCLFAMGVHWRGNDGIALAAVLENAFEFVDVAAPVLRSGDPKNARQAISHILTSSTRGQEEALRLARELQLTGFEEQAIQIALDSKRDQILRQTALFYLQLADGKTRRRVLPMLEQANRDLRLTAIQTFSEPQGLTAEDRDEIGPVLIRVAQNDSSQGHRQEAIFALGQWRDPMAREFFQQVLTQNPPVVLTAGHYNDAEYWRCRLRLVALVSLARLQDRPAREELFDLHRRGGPTERMDVLLAFMSLREVPDFIFEDLRSTEPKLVATAARLIVEHGDAASRERLKKFFARSPLWQEFRDSGIDDHNLLEMAGMEGTKHEH
jgi:hypothetical protein